MTDQASTNPISLDAPGNCPDPARFREIIQHILKAHFSDDAMAARSREAWQQTQPVPMPFAGNVDAIYHYRNALLALSPQAQAWVCFEEAVNRAFADVEDDGDAKDPAIPGWAPGWIDLA